MLPIRIARDCWQKKSTIFLMFKPQRSQYTIQYPNIYISIVGIIVSTMEISDHAKYIYICMLIVILYLNKKGELNDKELPQSPF